MLDNFGPALVLIRELRGLSQAAVARAAGIGKSQLSKYENGKELPRLDSLAKVLAALNIGFFEFSYTMKVLDNRESESTSAPTMPFLASADLGASVLHPETSKAFQRVFSELLKLFGTVHEVVLGGRMK
ncbi:MAG: helix-turn-helix transcriptional regulator [Acidobacteria bacterium]|nr:helix-turn-helix transcriptional regulator [Acidobacteriota bacterium]